MSRTPKSTGILRLSLGLACTLLIGGLYAQLKTEIAFPTSGKLVIMQKTDPDPTHGQTPMPLSALVDLAEVVERPLFDKSRRPPPVDESPQVSVIQDRAPQFRLEGVVVAGDERLAVLRVAGKTETVRVGQKVNGWLVDEIGYSAIVLSRSGDRQSIELVQGRRPPAGRPTVPNQNKRVRLPQRTPNATR